MQYQEKLYDGVCPTRAKIASLTEEASELRAVRDKLFAEGSALHEQNRSLQLKLGNCQCCSCDAAKCQEIAQLRALLERVPHHWNKDARDTFGGCCFDDCPRCAYEAIKEKP